MNWDIGKYEGIETTVMVSDEGFVVHRNKGTEITQNINSNGYLTCSIGLFTDKFLPNGKRFIGYKSVFVHRLVMSTFKPIEVYRRVEVNHINRNKLDNRLKNLEWVTHSVNISHSKHSKFNPVKCLDISAKKVKKICEMLSSGFSFAEINLVTEVSIETISKIRSRDIGTDISKDFVFKLPEGYASKIIKPYE